IDFVSKDLISDLPNHLISHILSLLSTKEAASTSVLSKRWHFLFASVPNFDFDDANEETTTSFVEFVDRVFTLLGNGTINKFSLSCGDGVNPIRISCWMLNVLLHGVTDLDLNVSKLYLCSLILRSKSLVKLRLGPRYGHSLTSGMEVVDVFLPNLRWLFLDSRDVGLAKLLAGCPMIEEITLMNLRWGFWKSCTVSITKLKRQTFSFEHIILSLKEESFITLKLVYVAYYDTIADKYMKISFDLIIEAHISLRLTKDVDVNIIKSGKAIEMVGKANAFLRGMQRSNTFRIYRST
ncbi:unnamed protein product, partial [Thlaspi arvense]